MEPTVIRKKSFKLLGSIFYGVIGKPWSNQNEIAKLWKRFGKDSYKYASILKKISLNPNYGYEIHIETEDYIKNNQYYVMTAVEVVNFEETPLEMFSKVLPTTDYVLFTLTMEDKYDEAASVYNKWLPENNFKQSYPFILQGYDSKRFKNVNDPRSEIDWYIPIKKIIESE